MRVSSPSLRSSSNFLRLLPHLPFTSIPSFIFPSVTCCRRQFLGKMWPIQFGFRLRISCRMFLCSLALSNTSPFLTRSVQLILHFQHHISKLSRCFWSTAPNVQVSAPYVILLHSKHRHVSATHMAIFRVLRTKIQIQLYCAEVTSWSCEV